MTTGHRDHTVCAAVHNTKQIVVIRKTTVISSK